MLILAAGAIPALAAHPWFSAKLLIPGWSEEDVVASLSQKFRVTEQPGGTPDHTVGENTGGISS